MNRNRLADLQNLEVEVDPKLWKSIEAELDRRGKRRMFFLWLLVGMAVSSSLVFYGVRRNDVVTNKNSEIILPEKGNEISSNKLNADRYNSETDSKFHSSKENNSNVPNPAIDFSQSENNTIEAKIERPASGESHNEANIGADKNELRILPGNGIRNSIKKKNSPYYSGSEMNAEANINAIEYVNYLKPFSVALEEEPREELIPEKKEITQIKSKHLSRWTFSVIAGISHSDSKSLIDTLSERSAELKSIDQGFYSGIIKYDISLKVALSIGVSTCKIAQSWSGTNDLYYPPNSIHPENYNMNTPLGSITGNATLMNQILLGHDTIFSLTFVGAVPDTTLTTEMKIEERFSYIQFPVSVYYKIINRRVSPFVSATFSTGVLTSNSIYLNDVKTPFNYNEGVSHTIFSAGLSAGTDVRIFRRWNAILQFQYERQLTPVMKTEQEWKPKLIKIGAGLGFRF